MAIATPARLAAAIGGRPPQPGERIGLLGGSFNPAHAGHLHISREALKRLGLDRVLWLVSPQNPLKPTAGMAPFAERLAGARRLARADRRIAATALESLLGTRYTIDTLAALERRGRGARLVWLMGADNLAQIDRWSGWTGIFHAGPIAVLARPSYALAVSSAKAAKRFRRARLPERRARSLAVQPPPAWVFLHIRLSSWSATRIRAASGRG